MGDVTTLFRLDPDALRCPYPLFDAVRDEQPVLFVPEIECWLVTRYADIVQVARDPQTFSSKMPTGPVLARQQLEAVQALLAAEPELAAPLMRQGGQARVLLSADPPDHARQRRLINPAFTPPKVKALEPRIRQVADELVDRFAARGRAEIVHEFGVLLPLTIIAECLGVADDELPQFKRWSDDFVAIIGNHDMSRDQLRSLLLSADPPDHARQRRLINPAFTPPKIKALEPRIREVAEELVDGFADRGHAELVHELGVLLPLTIIAECLGVADDELPQFKRWSDDFETSRATS